MSEPGRRDVSIEATLSSAEAALRTLAQLREHYEDVVAEARAALDLAAVDVHDRLHDYHAATQIEGDAVDLGLIRRIYWEYPEVKVSELATMLNLRGNNQVFEKVGAHTITRTCRDCGRAISRAFENRTRAHEGMAKLRYCDDCTAKRRADEQAAEARRAAAVNRNLSDMRATLDDAVNAGVEPSAVYVEYPGVPGTWKVDDATLDGGTIAP